MGKTDWAPIIIGGGLLIGGAYVWINWKTVCPSIFGADSTACTGATPLAAAEGIFTSGARYMSDKAPATSRVNTNPNASKNAATAIRNQQNFSSPKVIKASSYVKPANTDARKHNPVNPKDSPCTGPNAHLYPFCSYATFNSFNTITLNRMSVR